MSEPVSALHHASDTIGIAAITEVGPLGMMTLRGDLSASYMRSLINKVAGVGIPDLRQCLTKGDNTVAWMSPDELLVICPYAQVHDHLERMHAALATRPALSVNVSDARAVFDLSGPHARDVLAKLAPVDLHPDQFSPGMFRRTRIAQVPAAFWMTDDTTFRIVCFRSVAQYMFDLLKIAAQPGSEVAYLA